MSVAPPHLAKSSLVLGLNSGILSIAVANATVAAKLRQHVPELVVMLQGRGCEVNGIRIKVQVSFDRSQPETPRHRLGKTARDAIDKLCQTLGDSPLSQTLKKLIEMKE